MQGIYFLFGLIAIFVVIHWLVINDGKDAGGTRGLLAMKGPTAIVKRVRRKRQRWQHPAERDNPPETPDA
jgi:hypothetical protein